MSKIRLHGSSSGYTEIAPVAASGNNTLTLPNDGTIISKDSNGAVGVTSITVGTGVTIGDGRITCSTLHGSAANCTLIPAANIVGLATAGFNRSGGFGGITLADQWRLSSGFTGGATPITSNWERNDNGWSELGTGFSAPSSGVFTFPSTGYYWIRFQAQVYWTSSTPYIAFIIQYTSDNSSYNGVSRVTTNLNNVTDTTYGGASTEVMLKITDTSNQKVRASCVAYVGNETFGVAGSSTEHLTGFTFLRIGDI